MFETETMAELCLKQGLLRDALLIYRRLLASASDQSTRARHARRIAELERRDGEGQRPRSPSEPAAARPAPALQEQHDDQQVTLKWLLPLGTPTPALQILVLRRDSSASRGAPHGPPGAGHRQLDPVHPGGTRCAPRQASWTASASSPGAAGAPAPRLNSTLLRFRAGGASIALRHRVLWEVAAMFTGIITPRHPLRNDAGDEPRCAPLVDDQIKHGVDGLVPVGTTGESPTLNLEDARSGSSRSWSRPRAAVPVIAGPGRTPPTRPSTLSQEGAQGRRRRHAAGYALTQPPHPGRLYRHFKAFVEAVPLPTTFTRPGPHLVRSAARDGGAGWPSWRPSWSEQGATGNLQRASQIIARTGDRLVVLSGDDATAFPLFAVGARGVISVVSNVAPADMSAMWDAFAAGDWNKARELHYKLLPLGEGLFVEPNPTPVKAALAMMGRISEDVRPPLYPLSAGHREKLRGMLADLKLV